MSRVAWVLNLDADLEFAAGKTYSPSNAVLAAMEPAQGRLARLLVGAEDVLLGEGAADVGRAFCPTPRALSLFRDAGVEPEPYPDFAVLRRVNGRGFCAELGQTLPGAEFVTALNDALVLLAKSPPVGRQWRAKRGWGMAGRGQRPIEAGTVSDADIAFLRASLSRDGGIQIEPEVEIVREVGIHGLLAQNGDVRLGPVVSQTCDDAGQWMSSHATTEQIPALTAEANRVANALSVAGYFGPFGVDAYFYHHGGQIRLQPRSEINARYSMGFGASGLLRP